MRRLEGLTNAILGQKHIVGYCYTQLTDVEQEQNGIYNYDRSEKFDMAAIRRIFSRDGSSAPSDPHAPSRDASPPQNRCEPALAWGSFHPAQSRNDAEAAAIDGLQQKEMFAQKVGTSGPLVRSPTNGRASRASLPKSAKSEPVTIRQYGRDGRAPWKNQAKPRFSFVSDCMDTAKRNVNQPKNGDESRSPSRRTETAAGPLTQVSNSGFSHRLAPSFASGCLRFVAALNHRPSTSFLG
jgi:hypothetical protein